MLSPAPLSPRARAARAAVEEYRASLGEDFEPSAIAYAAGRALRAAGCADEAYQTWLGALDLPSARGWPYLMNALVAVALELGRGEDLASSLGERADRLPELHLWRGHLLSRLGAHEEALGPLARGVALLEGELRFTAVHEQMQALLALDRAEEALILCREARAGLPERALPLTVSEAGLLTRLDRPEEALELLDPLLERWPGLAAAWLNRGAALARLGRGEAAREALAWATRLEPGLEAAAARIAERLP